MIATPSIEEIIAKLGTGEKLREVEREALKITGDKRWVPNPGPQTEAYFCKADILLYGGSAGSGKSQLLLGLATNEHQRSIIFRRESSQTDGLESEGKKIIGETANFNGQDKEWTWPKTQKSLKLAGMKDADDWNKQAGRERDLYGFDEAGEFLCVQVMSLLGWNRGPAGQRCRVVLASNPPRSTDGLWMLEWFGPWLDRKFYDPALPGELRWALLIDGKPQWVEKGGLQIVDGKEYLAMSFTFIPASLADNPDRNTPEYRARLNALHEPLRSQLLYGDFSIGVKDDIDQLIPTAWVQAAMDKWKDEPPDGIPMCAIGVDCSGGGDDPMVIAPRYDGWYAPLEKIAGKDIPMERAGRFCGGLIVSYRRDRALVVVDLGGGYGGSLYEHLKANDIDVRGFKGAEGTNKRTENKELGFTNKRTAALWKFREALDPGQSGGSPIRLPASQRLLADLTAPRFEVTSNGIKAEDKKTVMKRIGRSTDEGDAVVMAWFEGPRQTTNVLDWVEERIARRGKTGQQPRVVMGRA